MAGPKAAATKTAKSRRDDSTGGARETTLSTGVKARLTPISAILVQDVVSRVPDPKPPMWYNKETEQEEPNPVHPDYIQALADVEEERSLAALDAAILFGVELVDGLPEDETWIKNLRYMSERLKILDLKDFDLDDEMDREFLYKRYVAVSADDYATIAQLSGVPEAEVARAAKTFRSN